MRKILTLPAALAALMMSLGCGDSGGGSSGSSGPSAAQTAATQKADGAGDAANQTVALSTEALADSGSNGAVSAKGTTSAAKVVTAFNYQASVNVTIDLDAVDAGGNDRWPNASGQLQITANGAISGDSGAGSATYDVQTTWLTPGVFTDPVSGVVATMAVGSGFQYAASLTWTWTAQDDWSVTAMSDLSGQHEVTVVDGGATFTATASGSRHAEVVFSQTPSGFSLTWNVSGTRTVTVTNGVETHVVTVTMLNPNHITITVDGVVFGPYTAYQIHVVFGCHMD